MDNQKLKKQDSKRVALSQRHEVDYCRKIAKQISEPFKFECNEINNNTIELKRSEWRRLQKFGSKVIRISKAFLKTSDALKEAKRSIKINHEVIDSQRIKIKSLEKIKTCDCK